MIELHVVGADVGEPHGEDVGLALDLDPLLGPDVGGGDGVDRLHLAGLDRGEAVGRLIDCRIWRASRAGVRARAADVAVKVARSRSDHSHSRFCRKPNWPGKVSVLRVVSIWKTLTPLAAMSRPMRQFEEWSSEAGASMNERRVAHGRRGCGGGAGSCSWPARWPRSCGPRPWPPG